GREVQAVHLGSSRNRHLSLLHGESRPTGIAHAGNPPARLAGVSIGAINAAIIAGNPPNPTAVISSAHVCYLSAFGRQNKRANNGRLRPYVSVQRSHLIIA